MRRLARAAPDSARRGDPPGTRPSTPAQAAPRRSRYSRGRARRWRPASPPATLSQVGRALPQPRPRVALVVPAWNEAGSIGAVLSDVPPDAVDGSSSSPGTAQTARRRSPGPTGPPSWAGTARGTAPRAGRGRRRPSGRGGCGRLPGRGLLRPPATLPRVLAPVLAGRADLALGWRLPGARRGGHTPCPCTPAWAIASSSRALASSWVTTACTTSPPARPSGAGPWRPCGCRR